MGNFSRKSFLEIQNNTNTDITSIEVKDFFMSNFDGKGTPKQFSGAKIPAHSSLKERLEIKHRGNKCGTGHITMILKFQNHLIDIFSFNQNYAINKRAHRRHKVVLFFNHIQCVHNITYETNLDDYLIIIKISNTQNQIINEKAETLAKEAKKHSDKKQYLQALQKIEQALKLANEKKTIQELRKAKSTCLLQLGRIEMENGSKLDNESKAEEAMKKFNTAKNYFKEAQKLEIENPANQITALDAKINGSKLFNEAVTLEENAVKFFKENQLTQDNKIVAQMKNRYQEALKKYEEAKKILEHGVVFNDKLLAKSVKTVNVAINEVKQSIEHAKSIELDVNFNNVYINAPKIEKTHETQHEAVIAINKQTDD